MIPPFPHPIKYGGSNHTTIMLTHEQEAWLRIYYPIELTTQIASMMGVHRTTILRLAKRRGLVKASAYSQTKKEFLSRKAKELITRERKREHFGLSRQTRYHLPQKPFTHSEIRRRHSASERGYIIGSVKGAQRYRIYFDNQTQRSHYFEANCIAAGFTISPYPSYE